MGSWADKAIEQLSKGEQAVIYPRGNSMVGRVESGQKVVVAVSKTYEKDDVVLCRCKGNIYLHLVKAVQGDRYLIGNNRGGTNGWVGRGAVYGKAIQIG